MADYVIIFKLRSFFWKYSSDHILEVHRHSWQQPGCVRVCTTNRLKKMSVQLIVCTCTLKPGTYIGIFGT